MKHYIYPSLRSRLSAKKPAQKPSPTPPPIQQFRGNYPPSPRWAEKKAAAPCRADIRRSEGLNSFLWCMALVFAGGVFTAASAVMALHSHYLAALLTGFGSSILWRAAFEEGRNASKNLSDS